MTEMTCLNCGHQWIPRIEKPNRCPKCWEWLPTESVEKTINRELEVVWNTILIFLDYNEPLKAKQIASKLNEKGIYTSSKRLGGLLRKYNSDFEVVHWTGGRRKWQLKENKRQEYNAQKKGFIALVAGIRGSLRLNNQRHAPNAGE